MSDMKALSRLMRELEDQLVVCMRCGMCQSVCPLYAQTGREADVARGKLALLDGLLAEMFQDPQGVYDRLNRCLLCGACAANCPSGVSTLEIFFEGPGRFGRGYGTYTRQETDFKRPVVKAEALR
jgi:glycolate oxidase iron-sulfur subunit